MKKTQNIKPFSFRRHTWQQLKQNKIAFAAIWLLGFFVALAVFAPWLANDKPFYISVNQHTYFPLLSLKNQVEFFDANGKSEMMNAEQIDWKHLNYESAIFPPIAYSANTSDILNSNYKSPNEEQQFKNSNGEIVEMPFRFRHFLGTNKRGEDVLSGLIHGASVSLLVGVFSMLMASIIGIFLGLIAGYFGDNKIKLQKGVVLSLLIGLVFAWFYAFDIFWNLLLENSFSFFTQLLFCGLIFLLVLGVFYFIGKIFSKISFLNSTISIPLDNIISRTIEVVVSLPTLLLIITIAAIAKPSITNLILIIALVQWTTIARFVRAEMLRLRNMEFMQAAEVLGLKPYQILLRHALPNVIAPALVSISFGVAAAILMESGLSFLGVGVPVDQVTWGSLINSGRENFQAWWLVLYPGLCIFLTVLVYNILGEALRDAMDVKLKS